MTSEELDKLSGEYAEKFEGAMDGSTDQKSLIEYMVRVLRHEMPELKGSEMVEIIESAFYANTGDTPDLAEFDWLLDAIATHETRHATSVQEKVYRGRQERIMSLSDELFALSSKRNQVEEELLRLGALESYNPDGESSWNNLILQQRHRGQSNNLAQADAATYQFLVGLLESALCSKVRGLALEGCTHQMEGNKGRCCISISICSEEV